MLKSSEEWWSEIKYFCEILDPDGWGRQNYVASWQECITKEEFLQRVGRSTAICDINKLIEWSRENERPKCSCADHQGGPCAAIKSIYAPKDFSLTKAKFGWHGTRKVDYKGQALDPDRLIIITDEQSHDPVPDPKGRAYMINVASNKNGVGYGSYIHIDGWSEAVVDYIRELEKSALA